MSYSLKWIVGLIAVSIIAVTWLAVGVHVVLTHWRAGRSAKTAVPSLSPERFFTAAKSPTPASQLSSDIILMGALGEH